MTSDIQPAQRYSFLHPLYMAFFSGALYRDVGRNWKGFGLAFLFSLVALCTIPFVLLLQSEFSSVFSDEAPRIIRQMPTVEVVKGNVSIDKPEPYYINDDKTGDPLIIFDTTGKIRSLSGSKAIMLVSRKTVTVKNSTGQTKTIDLSGVDDVRLDKRLLYELSDELAKSLAFILYPVAVFVSLLFRFIETAILALVASSVTRASGSLSGYRAFMRLAAVSMTPAMLLGAIVNIAGSALPFWWLTSLPLTVAYFIFAVRSNRMPVSTTGIK